MQARIHPNGILFYSRSRSIARPVAMNGCGVQHARHVSQAGELLQSGIAESPSIRNALFVTFPQTSLTSTSDNGFGTSADRDNEIRAIALPSNSKRLPWNSYDGIKSTPEWFDDLHYRDNSGPLALSTLNAILARLRQAKNNLSPRVLLRVVKAAIRAENPAAVRVYLEMLYETSKGQPLTERRWRQFGRGLVDSVDDIRPGHRHSERGSHAKQIWVEIITGLDVAEDFGRARLRKPSLYTLFPKGSPRAWKEYLYMVGTLRDADLLYGEWARFAQAELSSCAIAAESALSDEGGQTQLFTSSATELCATATTTGPSSEIRLADLHTKLKKGDMVSGPCDREAEENSIERQKRTVLANKVMCATFNLLVFPLKDYDLAWKIALESDPIFGAIDAQNWAQLLVKTDSFRRWTPKTNISMMGLLKEAERKSRDRPILPTLVAAIELLEADLGIEWMGAVDGHRTLDERAVGHFSASEEQSDESLTDERDEEQLHNIEEKQGKADKLHREHNQFRAAKKRRLATDLNRIDNLLRAFPLGAT